MQVVSGSSVTLLGLLLLLLLSAIGGAEEVFLSPGDNSLSQTVVNGTAQISYYCSSATDACVIKPTSQTVPLFIVQDNAILEITNLTVVGPTTSLAFQINGNGTLILRGVTVPGGSSAYFIATSNTTKATIIISNTSISGRRGNGTISLNGVTNLVMNNLDVRLNNEPLVKSTYVGYVGEINISNSFFFNNTILLAGLWWIDFSDSSASITLSNLTSQSGKGGFVKFTKTGTAIPTVDLVMTDIAILQRSTSTYLFYLTYVNFTLTVSNSSFNQISSNSQTFYLTGIFSKSLFDGVSFLNCSASTSSIITLSNPLTGGFIHRHQFILRNSLFRDNTAFVMQILSTQGSLLVEQTKFIKNLVQSTSAAGYGLFYSIGARAQLTSVIFRNCEFNNNVVTGTGANQGALISFFTTDVGDFLVQDSSFLNNDRLSANIQLLGTAIVNQTTISGCLFQNNSCISVISSSNLGAGRLVSIMNSTFIRNLGTKGIVYDEQTYSSILIQDTSFVNNTLDNGASQTNGGAVCLKNQYQNSSLDLIGCSFEGNQASLGGAVSVDGRLSAFDVIFDRNVATVSGGAVYGVTKVGLSFAGCQFKNNRAGISGGAIQVNSSSLLISSSLFQKNTSPLGSALRLLETLNLTLTLSTFLQNSGGYAVLITGASNRVALLDQLIFDTNDGGSMSVEGSFSDQFLLSDSTFQGEYDYSVDPETGLGGSLLSFSKFMSTFEMNGCNILGTSAPVGFFLQAIGGAGNFHFIQSTFDSNELSLFSVKDATTIELRDCNFTSNHASSASAALFPITTSFLLTGVRVSNNTYPSIWVKTAPSVSTISSSWFTGNSFSTSLFWNRNGLTNLVDVVVDQGLMAGGPCLKMGEAAVAVLNSTSILNCMSASAMAVLEMTDASQVKLFNSSVINVLASVGSAISIQGSSKLAASNSTFRNFYSGMILVNGDLSELTLADVILEDALTNESDGSLLHISRGAEASVTRSQLRRGTSTLSGGCIVLDSSTLTLTESEISNCMSSRDGAALQLLNKVNLTVFQTSFKFNQATTGGAVSSSRIYGSEVKFLFSTFSNNSATNGGVIYASFDKGNDFKFISSEFGWNSASGLGGVLVTENGAELAFDNCTFHDNSAELGGVGYLDWRTVSTITQSSLIQNTANSGGGCFYLDKTSSLTATFSTFLNNRALQSSGGVVALSLASQFYSTNSSFTGNKAGFNGGAIAVSLQNNCKVQLNQSAFVGNSAAQRGGAVFITQSSPSAFLISNSRFENGSARYGGALALESLDFTPVMIEPVTYLNNFASLYGNDTSSSPSHIETNFQNTSIFSGSALPSFQVFLYDMVGKIYNIPPTYPLQVFVTISPMESVGANPYLSGVTQARFENGVLTFSENSTLRAFGLPGVYRLKIGSSETDSVYNQTKFNAHGYLRFHPCNGTYYLNPDLSCEEIKCSGCKLENGGKCDAPGNCTCYPTLSGEVFEGLQCELVKDAYDSISLKFSELPPISKKRDATEINVAMRDFLLSELQYAYDEEKMNVLVKYRNLYQQGADYILKFSLIDKDGTYIEGDQLNAYEEIAQNYFLEKHGIQFESDMTVAEAQYLTYSDPIVVAVAVISAILIAIALGFFVLVLVYAKTPVIKSSSPTFCLLILLGMILAYLTFIPYVGIPTALSCSAPVVMGPLAFAVVFGNLFAKTFRIFKIFSNRKMRATAPSDITLLSISGAIALLEMILVIIWLTVDPPQPSKAGLEAERYYTCYASNDTKMVSVILAYSGVLLLFGSFLAVQTRKAYSAYRESQLIGFSIYTLTIVAATFLPVLYFIQLNLTAQFAIRSFGIIFVTSTTMFLLFGSKMYIIIFHPERNTTEFYLQEQKSSSTPGSVIHLRKKQKASGGESTADLFSSMTENEPETSGWVLVTEVKPWSQWRKKYAYRVGDFFGFFDNEDCHKGGLFTLHGFLIEKIETDTGSQIRLSSDSKTYLIDFNSPDDLEKWMTILSRPLKDAKPVSPPNPPAGNHSEHA